MIFAQMLKIWNRRSYIFTDYPLPCYKTRHRLPWILNSKKKRRSSRHFFRPILESLEDRLALSGSWVFQGPTNIQGSPGNQAVLTSGGNPDVGAVNIVLPDPSDSTGNTLYIAATDGGIWQTTNAYSPTPTWTSLNAGIPDTAISDLVFDPTDPMHQTLLAATGRFTNGVLPPATDDGPYGQTGVGVMEYSNGQWSLLPSTNNPLAGLDTRVLLATLQTPSGSSKPQEVLLAGTYDPNQVNGILNKQQLEGLWRATQSDGVWTWEKI